MRFDDQRCWPPSGVCPRRTRARRLLGSLGEFLLRGAGRGPGGYSVPSSVIQHSPTLFCCRHVGGTAGLVLYPPARVCFCCSARGPLLSGLSPFHGVPRWVTIREMWPSQCHPRDVDLGVVRITAMLHQLCRGPSLAGGPSPDPLTWCVGAVRVPQRVPCPGG